jgi:L-rhamnose mutarotase
VSLPSYGPTNPSGTTDSDRIQRRGSVIELLPEKEATYRRLHRDAFPEVLNTLDAAGLRNYNIFVAEIAGKKLLFSFFEFHGEDLEVAQRQIADCPHTQRWWELTDPCQRPLPGTAEDQHWLGLERVFFHAGPAAP